MVNGMVIVSLTSLLGLGLILATVIGLRRAADQARAAKDAVERADRAELLQTVVKLANKDNSQAKLLVEGLKEVTKTYTDSLTKLVIGYQPTEHTPRSNVVLDLNAGDNTFPIPTEYVPDHELQDRFMLDEEELEKLSPIPDDGKGGWT